MGEIASWGAYLFLLYALTTAYLAGCAPLVVNFLQNLFGVTLPAAFGALPVLILFGYFIYKGVHAVDWINRWMMIGLAIAYAALVILIIPYVDTAFYRHIEWPATVIAIPFIATSFGFHVVIPSLTTLMNRDPRKLRLAIWIGSAIPLVVYVIWIVLTLGIIPLEGKNGILNGYAEGANGASLLGSVLGSPFLDVLASSFSFFAIITSFLGVSISLSDCLSDGLKIPKNRTGKSLLCLLTFLPPLAFTLTDPRAFLSALDYAGAFGVMFLLGMMPALMTWSGRYRQKRLSIYTAPGGKLTLSAAVLFSGSVIIFELCRKLGVL